MSEHRGIEYTVTKRGTSWQLSVRLIKDGKPTRERKSHPTEEAARESCKEMIDRSLEGMPAQPPTIREFASPTLQRVFELVRDARWKGSKNEHGAVYNAEDCIKLLGPTKPIEKLTTEDVDGLIVQFKDRQLKPATIHRKLAALSTLVKYAAKRHWVKVMPDIDRKSAGKESKRLRFITAEEEADALAFLNRHGRDEQCKARAKEAADFFTMLIDTGLRLSEGVHLKWSELDGDKAIRFGYDNKGEQPRLVPLTDRVAAIIKARRAVRVEGEKRVWPDMTVDRAEHFWGLVREKLKLRKEDGESDFVIHACRHTFASRLAMQGVPLNVIKELGGWKTLDMVLRYAHLTASTKEDAIRNMQGWNKTGTNA